MVGIIIVNDHFAPDKRRMKIAMKTDRKSILGIITKTLLFLVGAVILVWAHYSNEQYKDKNHIEATSGATKLAE